MRQVQELEEAARERLANMDQEVAASVLQPLFGRLSQEYTDWTSVTAYLAAMREHIAANTGDFRQGQVPAGEGGASAADGETPPWLRSRPPRPSTAIA